MLERNCEQLWEYVTIMRVCHSSQIEVDHTGQIWDSLSTKSINYNNEQ